MKRYGVVLLALSVIGCGDIGAPTRADYYNPFLVLTPGDTTSFHWPQDSLPVRIWVQDTLNLPEHLEAALAEWNAVFLYHEFRATTTDDSVTAHVIVRGGFPDAEGGILLATAPECEGSTDMLLDSDNRTLTLPMRVYLNGRFSPDLATTQRCFGLVMKHELGHVLGILTHSQCQGADNRCHNDIMFGDPTVEALSARDRNAAEVLYHSPSNVVLIPAGTF